MIWARFFRQAYWDRDRAEELRSYLEFEIGENIGRGMSPEAARRAAHLKLGNMTLIREEIHRMNTISLLEALGRDLRLALRGVRRRPGFTLAVVLTLALGIGATTAIFGVVDAVLIRPLPYPKADELVSVEHVAPGLLSGEFRMSASQYFTYREEGSVFQHIGLYGDGGRTITGLGEPEQARALGLTYDVLQALGVQPQLGRIFTEADTTPAALVPQPMILSHAYWQRRFGGDRAVIGRRLTTDSGPAEVVGVMPEGFRFLAMEPAAEVIFPLVFKRSSLDLDGFAFWALARLKPGKTVADANADIARMLPIWLDAWPLPPNRARQGIENWRIAPVVKPLKDAVVGGVGDMLWVLMGTIGIVLLIACANVANLMLVRSESRRQEFALRTALGAGRGDIAREVLVESLVLSLIGGAIGVVFAYAGLKLVVATAPATLPRVEGIALDPRVMAFAIVVSLLSSILFGAIPALKYGARHAGPLGGAVRGASASRERQRIRNSLVVVQVALALVLLVASGLMTRTFLALLEVEPGFASTADLQTARVWVPPQQEPAAERTMRMQQQILETISALPGVTAAAFASAVPMEGPLRVALNNVFVDGQTYADGATPPLRRMKTVSPGYFRAIGTRMIAGRDLTWNDIYGRAKVVIISENFAREAWGSAEAALGQRISGPAPAGVRVWREIIGVVENVHEDALYQPAPSMVYWPGMMETFGGPGTFIMRPINLVIRSGQAGNESLLASVRTAVSSVNPNMPVFLVRTMKNLYDQSMARTSFALVMLGIAGAMALVLGVIGIYGVIAYIVAQRSREIGIRLALGAAPAGLMRMFVRQGLVLTGIGAALGLLTAVALTRWMSSLLFGVERLDPPTYAAVLTVLVLAAALASYVPARRAARVSLVETLTVE